MQLPDEVMQQIIAAASQCPNTVAVCVLTQDETFHIELDVVSPLHPEMVLKVLKDMLNNENSELEQVSEIPNPAYVPPEEVLRQPPTSLEPGWGMPEN